MNNRSIQGTIASFILIMMTIVSCQKSENIVPLENKGETIYKFFGAFPDTASGDPYGYRSFGITLSATPIVLEVAEVRRDVPNNEELNTAVVITVENDPGAITAYNAKLKSLPLNSYSVDPSTPLVGTDYTVPMAAGEFAKVIKISVNTQLLDLSNRYAMGFKIAKVSGKGKIADKERTIVVELVNQTKNKWDGVYSITGDFEHPDPCLAGPFFTSTTGGPREIELVTISENSLQRKFGGRENFTVWNNCGKIGTYFTTVVPRYQVNADNTVTILDGPESTVTWNYGSPCSYDDATKTFNLNYGYVGTTSPVPRVIKETMRYLRPRQ